MKSLIMLFFRQSETAPNLIKSACFSDPYPMASAFLAAPPWALTVTSQRPEARRRCSPPQVSPVVFPSSTLRSLDVAQLIQKLRRLQDVYLGDPLPLRMNL